MPSHDYYTILGISRSASPREIKQAYRRQAFVSHPDRNPGDAAAEERFKQIAQAYSVLSDQKKRTHYDHHGQTLDDMVNAQCAATQQNRSHPDSVHTNPFRTTYTHRNPFFAQTNFLHKYSDHAILGILAITFLSAAYTYKYGLNVAPFTWVLKPEVLEDFYQYGTYVDTATKNTELWFGTFLGVTTGVALTGLAELTYTICQKLKRV